MAKTIVPIIYMCIYIYPFK